MVSTPLKDYSANVVTLGRGRKDVVTAIPAQHHKGREQRTYTGSYALIASSPVLDELKSLTVRTWIYPTRPGTGEVQGVVTRLSGTGGWGLIIDGSGRLALVLESLDGTTASCVSREPLRARNWYEVVASYDHVTGRSVIAHEALEPWPERRRVSTAELPKEMRLSAGSLPRPLLIGGGRWVEDPGPHATQAYDGKIENPSVFAKVVGEAELEHMASSGKRNGRLPSPLIQLDFGRDNRSTRVHDSSSNGLHGVLVNMPARGVTGNAWSGTEQGWTHAPEQYAAIHFHSDDVADSAWEPDFEVEIPTELRSGAYAVRLVGGDAVDEIPFFVTAGRHKSRIAFIVPTLTYLAYGNSRKWLATMSRAEPHRKTVASDVYIAKHPELGMSLYDSHSDGSGCFYASRLRPIVQMRPVPKSKPRHFPADLLLLEWMNRRDLDCDVVTDEDLHLRGQEAIGGYQALITGSHPEYYSAAMLDALTEYVRGGGKLLYLGGNGFYWVTSFHPERPDVVEIRRGIGGTRDWNSEPGEHYHSSTGEFGGLWRHRGRAPNQLVGVAFSAVGGVGASGYARQADSFRDDVSFIFEGLTDDELIGDFGAIGGGAAGDELDRIGFELGTPPTTLLLATSAGMNPTFKVATEEIKQTKEVANNPKVRADMTYYTNEAGGAVFSVGSINWFGSLATNGDDNNVSRITENVLRHFTRDVGAPDARVSRTGRKDASKT